MTNEASDYYERTPEQLSGYETIGAIRSMLANRLSFQFDFKGVNLKRFYFNFRCIYFDFIQVQV